MSRIRTDMYFDETNIYCHEARIDVVGSVPRFVDVEQLEVTHPRISRYVRGNFKRGANVTKLSMAGIVLVITLI